METSIEAMVLRLLEQALGLPASERDNWLRGLDAPPAVIGRLRQLLDEAAVAEDFLDTPPELPSQAVIMALPHVGERLGAWLLERELGSGGMGVVFLASRADGAFEQMAALKVMRGEFLLLDTQARLALANHFDNERQLLARLRHPNVARILDGGSTAAGVPWLVMEYVDGEPLTDYCDHCNLDVRGRLRLFCKLCDGVQAAHQHLIVHRDLKPGNVLVDGDGEPKLLDFGIARALETELAGDATRTGTQAMTPAYASPEQFAQQPLTTASDVYSLGVMLFELLTGSRPYSLEGLSPAQSDRVISESRPHTLRQALAAGKLPDGERQARQSRIGGDLERIVAKAMHKDPARRYGSAQALAEDLRRLLGGQPVQAHPDSMGYRAGKFLLRHRLGSIAAALAVVAVLAAAGMALMQAREARAAAADTERVNAFLLEVLNVSNPFEHGREVTLSKALDEAAAKVDTFFKERPDLAIDVHNALAQSMFTRERLDASEAQARRALDAAERLFGHDDRRAVTALSILANIRQDQYRDEESQQLFRDALERLERSGQQGTDLHADILNDLGVLFLIKQDYAAASKYLQRAIAAGRHDSADSRAREEHARSLANLAQAESGLGHYDHAESLFAQAQPVLEHFYPDGGPHLAVILNNRASLARRRGKLDQAFELQKQAVAMQRRSFKGDNSMILVPMTNLSRIGLQTGHLELAAQSAEDAAAMAVRLYPGHDHPYLVNALVALARVRLAQGRAGDAATLLARARGSAAKLDKLPGSIQGYLDQLKASVCAEPIYQQGPACRPDPAG